VINHQTVLFVVLIDVTLKNCNVEEDGWKDRINPTNGKRDEGRMGLIGLLNQIKTPSHCQQTQEPSTNNSQ
jgi:hypothetical protein